MIITTVSSATAPGVLGEVTGCIDAGEVRELVLCEGEITLIRPDGTVVEAATAEFGPCPRCGAFEGEEHSCGYPAELVPATA